MKRKSVSLLTLLLAVLMLLSGCGNNPVKLKYDEQAQTYTDSKHDVTYLRAPIYYEAAGVKIDLPYAKLDTKLAQILYQIDDADPEDMIANEYFEIFYSDRITMPKLWEMGVDRVLIGMMRENSMIDLTVATIANAQDIEYLIGCYQSADTLAFPKKEMLDGNDVVGSYRLRFASAAHPAFFYCLEYYQYEEDVVIYEVIESKESFVPTYAGALSTSFDESYVDRGQLYAVYYFGKNILCDPVTGECFAVRDTVAKYLDY